MSNKKSQVTLFIVIGITIVLVAGVGFYMYSSGLKEESEGKVKIVIEKESMFEPISVYLETYVINEFNFGLQNAFLKIDGDCTLNIDRCAIKRNDAQPDAYGSPGYTYGEYILYGHSIPEVTEEIENYLVSALRILDFSVFEEEGFEFVVEGDAVVNIQIHDKNVIIDLDYPLTAMKADSSKEFGKLSYRKNIDIGGFLKFINESLYNESTILNYEMTNSGTYSVEKTYESIDYDTITFTNDEITIPSGLLTLKVNIENRPADANTIYITDQYGNKVDSVIHSENLTLNCPNYNTYGEFVDPDQDDRDSNVVYSFDFDGSFDLSQCGNSRLNVTTELDRCDVCTDITVNLIDQAGLVDFKNFSNVVLCDAETGGTNGCCAETGCWDSGIRGECGYEKCPWEPIQSCEYRVCNGGCGEENEEPFFAVILERQYADICDSCGGCICSGGRDQIFRQLQCPPNEECPDCGGGGIPPGCIDDGYGSYIC